MTASTAKARRPSSAGDVREPTAVDHRRQPAGLRSADGLTRGAGCSRRGRQAELGEHPLGDRDRRTTAVVHAVGPDADAVDLRRDRSRTSGRRTCGRSMKPTPGWLVAKLVVDGVRAVGLLRRSRPLKSRCEYALVVSTRRAPRAVSAARAVERLVMWKRDVARVARRRSSGPWSWYWMLPASPVVSSTTSGSNWSTPACHGARQSIPVLRGFGAELHRLRRWEVPCRRRCVERHERRLRCADPAEAFAGEEERDRVAHDHEPTGAGLLLGHARPRRPGPGGHVPDGDGGGDVAPGGHDRHGDQQRRRGRGEPPERRRC